MRPDKLPAAASYSRVVEEERVKRKVALLVAALWIGESVLYADSPKVIEYRWSELSPLITNRKVALTLPTGTQVEGKVQGLDADALRLRVSKTSNRKDIPKGNVRIPRTSVSLLRVTDYRIWGRLAGTLGAMAATTGIILAQNIDLYEGPQVILVPALSAVAVVGAGVAGYYVGKRIDKRVIYIRITPENGL